MKKPKLSIDTGELRRRAEAQAQQGTPGDVSSLAEMETKRLVHELQVHQIELELQNEELFRSRAEVEAGLERFVDLYDLAPVGYLALQRDGGIVQSNLHAASLLGVPRTRLVGGRLGLFITDSDRQIFSAFLAKVFESQGKEVCEVALQRQDIRPPSSELTGSCFLGEASQIVVRIEAVALPDRLSCRAVISDISQSKRIEERRRAENDLLQICHFAANKTDLMRELMLYFRRVTGCEAVGVRLNQGDDFPYFETRGFSDSFLVGENTLCAKDARGEVQRDSAGNPILECMCGNILCGRFDASKPFFTKFGSFWSSCTTDLLADTSEDDRQGHTRNRCNSDGYESVALIPLRMSGKPYGLFQFNDRRRGCFSVERIEWLEHMVDYIALALANLMSTQALSESENRYRALFDQTGVGTALVETKTGRFVEINQKYCDIVGYTKEEMLDSSFQVVTYAEDVQEDIDKNALLLAGKIREFSRDKRYRHKDGSIVWGNLSVTPLWLPGETPAEYYHIAVVQDISERKRAEEKLVESEKLLSRAQGIAQTGSWKMDIKGNRLTWSDEVYRIFGCQPQEFASTYEAFLGFIHPDDRAAVDEAYSRSLREGADSYEIEHRIVRRKSGEVRYVHERCVHDRDDTGAIIQSTGMVQDITERRRAEELITKNKVLLNDTERIGKIGGWEFNVETLSQTWTDETFRILEIDLTAGAPKVPEGLGFFNPPYRQMVEQAIQRAIETGEGYDQEWEITTTKGNIRWVHAVAKAHQVEGKTVSLSGSFQDITERRQAQEALKASEFKYRSLIENSGDAVFCVDRNGEYQFVNQVFASTFGQTPDYFIGKTFWDIYPKEHADQRQAASSRVFATGESQSVEVEVPLPDRTLRFIAKANPVRDEMGNVVLNLTHATDITERVQAEEALRESEERFSQLFDHMADGVAVYRAVDDGQDFIFEDLNKTGQILSKVSLDEVVGRRISEVFPAVEQMGLLDVLRRVWRSGQPERHPLSQYADGRIMHWVENYIYKLPSGLVVAIYSDTTAKRRTEEALRDSEEKYRTLFDNAGDAIFIHDMQGHLLEVNQAAVEQLGYTYDELIGMNIDQVDTPAEAQFVPQRIATLAQQGHLWFETVHQCKDGSLISTEIGAQLIILDDQPAVMSICRDITERKKAEKALRESEERFRQLFQSMDSGFALHELIYDAQGVPFDYRFLEINQAFEKLTGLESEKVIRHTVLEVMPGTEKEWIERYARVALSGEPIRFESYARELGKYYQVTTYSPRPGQFATIIHDITEAKKAADEKQLLQEQLLQAQKMESVGRLAGGVAHDFNNLLGVIIGRAETALTKVSPHQPVYQDLHEILKAGGRSANLTRQLLAFARKQPMSPIVLDLNNSVASILEMLRRLIGEEIDLVWNPGADLWHVLADPSQIDQVLTNLLVNSRDAITGVGEIVMQTSNIVCDALYCAKYPELQPGDYCLLSISDNGSGMDRQTLSHLFEPFFTTKELGKGTGLGLSTVFGIIKQNNGYIKVASEPGQGTTFNIYLPRVDAEVEPIQPFEPTGTPQGTNEIILMVEDEEALLDLGKETLEGLGYQVLAAGTPAAALRLVQEHTGEIQLLITDVIMPGMNGKALAEELHATLPGLKCLFMSGYTADIISERGVLPEGMSFIQKPFSLGDLAKRVQQILGQKSHPHG